MADGQQKFMKTIPPPVCENGGKDLRASCTRLPTIGSPHWEEEGQKTGGGVASLSLASFRKLVTPFGWDQQECAGEKSVKIFSNVRECWERAWVWRGRFFGEVSGL